MNGSFYDSNVTKISITPPTWEVRETDRFFFAGSCFAENLYNSLNLRYLSCQTSPWGNIYNPLSLAACLKELTEKTLPCPKDIIENDGVFRHFSFHSKVHSSNREELKEKLQTLTESSSKYLLSASVLVITLGTAWVFEKEGEVVNNCHKMPGKMFTRRLLHINEITEALKDALSRLKSLNPRLKTVITVSPVRHLRDSFTDNSLSKALLRVAAHEISQMEDIWYFPSLEIIMDELRDYRWYDRDLVHPGKAAVEYIMDLFIQSCASKSFLKYIEDIDGYNSMKNHKILLPDSHSAKKFLLSLKKKKNILGEKYPDIKERL